MDGAGADRLSFLGRPLPAAFELLVITVAPGREHPFEAVEWRDSFVLVERGEIELERASGEQVAFACGDVLHLIGLPLRLLRNRGPETAVLAVVRRRAASRVP